MIKIFSKAIYIRIIRDIKHIIDINEEQDSPQYAPLRRGIADVLDVWEAVPNFNSLSSTF